MASRDTRFKFFRTFVLLGISGAALSVAERKPIGADLTLNQVVLLVSIVTMALCDWLVRVGIRERKSTWIGTGIAALFWVSLTAAVWAFVPVISYLLK